jgi:D-alanyl-D-alanine carboxypeptidase/D-alanyl-D-alanine-endopeptidase (penicillin-binding protein 4)
LLRYAYANSKMRRLLFEVLPIAGIDGTLKKRMQLTPAEGNVRAKTGSVTGVSTLAGYCTTAHGHTLCFVIFNQGLVRASHGRAYQDKVLDALTSGWPVVEEPIEIIEEPTDTIQNPAPTDEPVKTEVYNFEE